jgi:1-acyl-sn-glycerol-3-phosphate acyltransferase
VGFVRSMVGTAKVLYYFARYGLELLFTQPKTRADRAAWLNRFCAATLNGMGIVFTVEGQMPSHSAIISNHLGYLDIIVFAAIRPCVFCSKAELGRVPVLGWFVRMAGTVFVERGQGGSALKAKGDMEAAFRDGLPVVFFPEGTTSNGEQVLDFHSGLLAQAMGAGMPVTASFLHYRFDQPNGNASIADDVHYWGDGSMWPHIWRFVSLRGVHAYVRFAPVPIAFVNTVEKRKEAALEARTAVLQVGQQDGLI